MTIKRYRLNHAGIHDREEPLMIESEHGTGRTTQAMKDAPVDAVYVCSGSHAFSDAQDLRTFIKRPDLRIVSPSWLDTYRGVQRAVIVDHACQLTPRQIQTLDIYQHDASLRKLLSV